MSGRLRSLAALVVGGLLASGAILFATRSVQHVDPTGVDIGIDIERWAERLGEVDGAPGSVRFALLGDSIVVANPAGRRVSDRLAALLRGRPLGPTVQLHNFARVGFGPPEQFAIADVIANARPDVAAIGINLASFAPAWEQAPRRPELAAWIEPARAPAATRILLDMGMTFDQLVGYMTVVGVGAEQLWSDVRRRQLGVERAALDMRQRLGGPVATPAPYPFGRAPAWYVQHPARLPLLEDALLVQYGAVLGGLPGNSLSLQLIEATVRRLVASGAETIVFLLPMNVELLRTLGLLDEAGLARSVERIEQAVDRAGGRLVDLHALLPRQAFRDVGGHFALAPVDSPLEVARALEPHIAQSLGRLDGAPH